jgi:hypothetical protein
VSGGSRIAFAVAAAVAVLAAIAAGMAALGSPREQRARRMDDRRLADLRSIAEALEDHWDAEHRLPGTLDELPPAFASSRRDPETGAPYEYVIQSADRYRLCATFDRDARRDGRRPPPGVGRIQAVFWTHGAGHDCFDVHVQTSEPHR